MFKEHLRILVACLKILSLKKKKPTENINNDYDIITPTEPCRTLLIKVGGEALGFIHKIPLIISLLIRSFFGPGSGLNGTIAMTVYSYKLMR